jgi:Helix-turn-helix
MKKTLKERRESHILYSDTCWGTDLFCRKGHPMIFVKGRRLSVARLMYQITFDVKLEWDQLVLHNCGNKECIRPDHLYLGSLQDSLKSTKSLTEGQIEQIKQLINEEKLTQKEIGEKFGIHNSTVSKIKNGKYPC